jgi:hypothetical protein
MWGFQPSHQAYILEQQLRFLELYNIEEDPSQKRTCQANTLSDWQK